MKTYAQKPADVTREWFEISADGQALGRIANQSAQLLIGKHKSTYTPHVDGGDFVIITHAEKVVLTGRKGGEKKYHHTGFPGGIKSTTKSEELTTNPVKLIEDAVRGMVPANKLRPDRMKRLKVVVGAEHPHTAQKPKALEANRG